MNIRIRKKLYNGTIIGKRYLLITFVSMCPGKLSKIERGYLRSDSKIFNTAIIGHHFEHYSILNSFETVDTDVEL